MTRDGLRIATGLPVLAVIALLLAGCGDDGPRLPPLAPDAVVLAFGDSLTYGSGAARGQAYPDVLAGLIGRKVVNAGVPGEVSASGRERLPRLLDQHAPALLILCHGGNDMLRRQDPKAMAANLRAMIDEARARGISVVLLGVPAPGIFLGTAELYAEVATAAGVPLENEALAEILGQRDLKADPIHPNSAGYRELALRVQALLRDAGALPGG